MKAWLALEDGLVFEGEGFGAEGEIYGEVVFNTALTGYQEILTDPSYKGQIVTMTYPHIGNYGITPEDDEAGHPWAEGFVVRELSPVVSNYRSKISLHDYLKKYNKIGIQEVDTRKIVKHLRDFGAKKGILSTADGDHKRLVKKAQDSPSIVGINLVKEVTCKAPYEFREGLSPEFQWGKNAEGKKLRKIVAVDCGVKRNILRKLNQHGFDVKVVPSHTSAQDILKEKPEGVFLSNGPGDPEAVTDVIETVRGLVGKVPIFGICLGHQMLGLALGGKTTKLKFGHRGGNHPVMDRKTKKIEITSQNHGFAVEPESLPADVEVTHHSLNDQCCEGLAHKKYPIFSVQYHPENAPGPHDSDYLFERFREVIEHA